MSEDIYSIFEKYEFYGEFFCKDTQKFIGSIRYSPEEGLLLQYRIADGSIPSRCDYLWASSEGNWAYS